MAPLITLRNSFEPILLFSGIIFLYFSSNLAAAEKDFKKKEKGMIKYFEKLKSKMFLFKNKAKKKKSRYALPQKLKNARNELDLKNSPAENKRIAIRTKICVLFNFTLNLLASVNEKIIITELKIKKEMPVGFW